jgi:DNA anti-recombination protein RmuC|tara:strand:+ start:572 stop:1165 length:594 start_codon:yes stop_codon:yes gene_type:complete
MSEKTTVEVGGVKFTGGKLFLVITVISSICGAAWGGFEFYNDYRMMKTKIERYTAPDLTGLDKRIAIQGEKFAIVDAHMEFVSKEIDLFKEEITMIKEINDEHYQTLKDLKQTMRDDITRQEKIIDKVEDEVQKTEDDVRQLISIADGRFENKRSQLQADYEQKADSIRKDTDRKLKDLEDRLNKRLQRALDNPLAN